MARKSIFITGGGSGIGRAIAQKFAHEGWFVGLGDISDSGMAETAKLIGENNCSIHHLDVRDRAAWDAALEAFSAAAGGRISHLDGISVDFDDWHFNVRPSNTEPLLRLNLEAASRELMDAKRDEVIGLIRS